MNPTSRITNYSNQNSQNKTGDEKNISNKDYKLTINELEKYQRKERLIAITAVALTILVAITLVTLQFALPGAGLMILAPAIALSISVVTSTILITRMLLRAREIVRINNKFIKESTTQVKEQSKVFNPNLTKTHSSNDQPRRLKISKELKEIDEILGKLESPIRKSSLQNVETNSSMPSSTSNKEVNKETLKKNKQLETKKVLNKKNSNLNESSFLAPQNLSHYKNLLRSEKKTKQRNLEKEGGEIKQSLLLISKNIDQLGKKISSGQDLITPYQASYLYSGIGSSSEISELLKHINHILANEDSGVFFLLALIKSQSTQETLNYLEPLFSLKKMILEPNADIASKKAALIDFLTLTNLFLSGWLISKNSELKTHLIRNLSQKLHLEEDEVIHKFFIRGNYLEMISLLNPSVDRLLKKLLRYDVSSPSLTFDECCADLRRNEKFAKQLTLAFSEREQHQNLMKRVRQFFSKIENYLPKNSLGLISFANNLPNLSSEFQQFFSRFHPDVSCLLLAFLENSKLKEKILVILPRGGEKAFEKVVSILSLGMLRCGFIHKNALKLISSSLGINEKELEKIILNKELGKNILK
ncbi:CT214 family putative inclusion membrane protein [Chlamydiifrater volucris]|uniref:CT214 family putative inclusion membrane protein n=1 Tax=Chlamydiifrater volucris TaxID=2681470 RepID=UPI001BD15D63|nr:hypothetical protein [Chlamydiifrater volucris]